MTDSKPVRRGKGKPFVKGPDPRRNLAGNLNAEAQSYEINFRNALADGLSPREFAQIVAEGVRRNRPGYKELAAKYLIGEPAQKHDFNVRGQVAFIMPRPAAKPDGDAQGDKA